jgi:hypothetical protein
MLLMRGAYNNSTRMRNRKTQGYSADMRGLTERRDTVIVAWCTSAQVDATQGERIRSHDAPNLRQQVGDAVGHRADQPPTQCA